jgi:predicted ABC-type sugar transport system permease subunit
VKAVVSLHVHPFAVAVAAFQENKTSGDGFLLQQESHPLTKDKWIFCLIGSGKLQPFPHLHWFPRCMLVAPIALQI